MTGPLRILLVLALLSPSAPGRAEPIAPDAIALRARDARRIAEVAALIRAHRLAEALQKLDLQPFVPELDVAAKLLRAQVLESVDFAAAWTLYSALREKFPNDPNVQLRAGVAMFRRRNRALAEELLTRSWQSARTPETAYYLGRIHLAKADDPAATYYFAECIALDTEFGEWRNAAYDALLRILKDSRRVSGQR